MSNLTVLPDDQYVDFAEFGLTDMRESVTHGGVHLVSATFPAGTHDEVWRALRQAHGHTGRWPVLSWMAHTAASYTVRWRQPQGQAGLAKALQINPAERMALLVQAAYEGAVEDYDAANHESIAEWRDAFDADLLARRLEPVDSPPPGVGKAERQGAPTGVLLVPAAAGYEVPILVPGLLQPANWFGGASHPDLTLADHVAVLRHWEQQYGAQLYFASGSYLELTVDKPPRDPGKIARSAIEQMSYCGDLHQFIGDEEDVARHQVPAGQWSFWWD
jgi:hypothetical protein